MGINILNNKNRNLITFDLVVFFVCMFLAVFIGEEISLLFFLFAFFVFLTNNTTCTTICRDVKFYCLVIVILYMMICALPLSGLERTFGILCSNFSTFFGIILFDHFKNPQKREQLNLVYKFSWGITVFLCIYSTVIYTIFPGFGRPGGDAALGVDYLNPGYSFAWGISFFCVFLLDLLLKGFFDYDKKKKNVIIAAIILMVFTVYKTESTITIVLLTIGIFTCIYFRATNKKTLYLKILLVPIIVAVIYFLVPRVGDFLIDYSLPKIDESKIYKRLYSLGCFFVYGNDNVDALYSVNRISIPFESFKTFLKNPVFGVAYKHGCRFYHPRLFGVGDHCEFVDVLTNYGIFVGTAYLSIYFLQIKEILKASFSFKTYTWIFLIVLLGTFNPFSSFYISFFLSFMIPSFCLINEKRLKNNIQIEKEKIP